jgi:hypothetical protein
MITRSDITQWIAAGWQVFPCHDIEDGACSCGKGGCTSQGKHPRIFNGVRGATADMQTIDRWLAEWPAANWAVATGHPSGIAVIDVDTANGKEGEAALARMLGELGLGEPDTFAVRTGSGGRHLYFRWEGGALRSRVNLRPGLDIRADGGYVLLPGSNHISGGVYTVERASPLARVPDMLARVIAGPSESASPIAGVATDDLLAGVPEGSRDDALFRAACRWRRELGDNRAAVTLLVLEAARNCTPPFPEGDALVKVEQAFAQDHSDAIDLDRVPFLKVRGEMPDFLQEADPDLIRDVEKGVRAAEVRGLVARVRREQRVAKYGDSAAVDGYEFMFGEVAEDVPIWGDGDRLLWTEGGGLMIPSDQGLGKSFTAQQIVLGRLGLGPGHLLGLTLHKLAPEKSVVYLALDRPRQIARSMVRLFNTDAEREVAKQRLKIWTKTAPIDILGDSHAFADWLQDTFGTGIGDVIVDSVKDLTPADLSKGDVGQALDMAWKECRARGMSTLLLHHERKTGNDASRANRQPSLDNIYGSVWLTSGMDSVLHIQGQQGANIVTYTHLKPIIDLLDPIDAMHDQERGRTDVLGLTKKSGDPSSDKVAKTLAVIARETQGGAVVTATDVALATGISPASVNRYIKALLSSGQIEEASPYDRATATAATYRLAQAA